MYREKSEEVFIDYLLLKKNDGVKRKPMIVVHGMFGSMNSLKSLCDQDAILSKRDCYLVDLRNGIFSDHHDHSEYHIFAHDIIRFADKHGLDKFDIMGHSMGARTGMTITCMFPERVDGVIAIDAGPVKWVGGGDAFYASDMYKVMKSMKDLSEI